MKPARSLVALVVFVGAGVALYTWLRSNHQQANSPAAQSSPLQASSNGTTASHYPVPREADFSGSENKGTKAVPRIDESDQSIEEMLASLVGKERLENLFNLKNIVRRFVVTVHNIDKHEQISEEYSPFNLLERGFRVKGNVADQSISSGNFQRYLPYVKLAQTVDSKKLVAIYVHFYPLFQSAYQDLGNSEYFNDRLVQSIDVILNTPEVNNPIKVEQVGAHRIYKFSDDQLESLPAVQKIMVRMGNENAAVIKNKMRELRALLIHLDKRKIK